MKKQILLIVAMCISLAVTAQNDLSLDIIVQPQITRGGDFNVWKSYSSPFPLNKSTTMGIQVGIAGNYGFTDKLSISSGLIYSSQGQKYEGEYSVTGSYISSTYSVKTYNHEKTVSLKYINIPFQLNFCPNPGKSMSFMASAGFYIGLLAGYKDEMKIVERISSGSSDTYSYTATGTTMIKTSGSYTTDYVLLTTPYESADFGITLSGGFLFKINDKISAPLLLNMQIGFSNIKDNTAMINSGTYSELYWSMSSGSNLSSSFRNFLIGLRTGIKIKI